ncbi:hypothetical protein [Erwinia oleae]|nr:hypothetical protein [Erwinia oleae]
MKTRVGRSPTNAVRARIGYSSLAVWCQDRRRNATGAAQNGKAL